MSDKSLPVEMGMRSRDIAIEFSLKQVAEEYVGIY